MNKLALQLPGGNIVSPPPTTLTTQITDLAGLVSIFINIAFYAAMFLAFFFLVWGAFAYIMAGGDKENLAKARARITWAIIGLFVVLLAFVIAKFAAAIFQPAGEVPF